MDDKTYIPYQGPSSLTASQALTLFDSSLPSAFGIDGAPHFRCFWVDLVIGLNNVDNAPTAVLERSIDRGVSWTQVDSEVVTISNTHLIEFFVSPYRNWRIRFLNGIDAQSTFNVEMTIDHNSRGRAP